MYGKVILSLALVAFVSVPWVDSLKCHECLSVQACKNPTTVQCDQAHANTTRDALFAFYPQVEVLNTTNYSCFIGAYKSTNVTIMDVRGCINTGTVTCNSQLLNTTWTKDTCNVCQRDLCNKKNSVGSISSSIVTMMGLMFLAKAFVM